MSEDSTVVANVRHVSLGYRGALALDDVSVSFAVGRMTGVVGPDGVGKSSLLSLIAGARRLRTGEIDVFGHSIADSAHRRRICSRIAFMPQGLGRNLYPDLTVSENIAFFARLFDQPRRERTMRIASLLRATGLTPFPDRLARDLSGGMRQKLSLCCALVHDPDLLVLDEPTTGVDPLSRRHFWSLIAQMRRERPRMTVVVATAYMEEAEQFDSLVVMNEGRILARGPPGAIKKGTGTRSLEESFIALVPRAQRSECALIHTGAAPSPRDPVIVARGLTRRFETFTAVDHVDFEIGRGEIFGFLGSNGCGKTTTMKMLTGLLPATSGTLTLFGRPVGETDLAARYRVGYMSQSFSLFTELTAAQNLALHARLFHLGLAARARIESLCARFGLDAFLDRRAGDLPLGLRQRLSLAVAVLHAPEILVLDEPTSGVDPVARDGFWQFLISLSRSDGITIFVSTHFMNEAERCDRVALMHAGRVLVVGHPGDISRSRSRDSLEAAFIDYLEDATRGEPGADAPVSHFAVARSARTSGRCFSLRRLLAYTIREARELMRDRVRLGFALLGTAFLMSVFAIGISTDVEDLTFAVLDRDNSHESRTYLEEVRGSSYFTEKAPLKDDTDLMQRLRTGDIKVALEVPPNFGRFVKAGKRTEIGAWIDGAMPFRAETIRGYLVAAHQQYLTDDAIRHGEAPVAVADESRAVLRATNARPPTGLAARPARYVTETRFLYNPNFESIYAQVPGSIALLLVEIPAILMALAIVREKELGSITNLYVTPVTRLEFLIGKQIPYIVLGMINFAILSLMAVYVFHVPLKGSLLILCLGALIYVSATTAFGMVISAFCRTQIAALFGTAILTLLPATTFSGMLTPVSSLTGLPAALGIFFPMTYFLKISVGTFTKALGFRDLAETLLQLAAFVPVLTLISLVLLAKQER